jgi:hypothetical protein
MPPSPASGRPRLSRVAPPIAGWDARITEADGVFGTSRELGIS